MIGLTRRFSLFVFMPPSSGLRKIALAGAFAILAFAGCTTAPPPPPAPPPEPVPDTSKPIVITPQRQVFDSDPDQRWNIFPDPTTGEVGIYHDGQYMGGITGDETEDPPIPHPTRHPPQE